MHGNLVEKEAVMSYPRLHTQLSIGPFTLANRLIMPPLVIFKAAEDGSVTAANREHYAESSGPGYMVVEATAISPEGRLARNQIGIFEDRHIEGLAELARIIRGGGAVAGIQIHHAGGRTTTKNTFGLPMVGPSPIATPEGEVPLELDEEGIQRIIGCFVAAARRAKQAGFQALEVHGAHGYLGSQFLSPLANKRTDRWGGSLENRARFLREVLAAVRKETGSGMLVYTRLAGADKDPGGLTPAESVQVARWLKADGVPIVHMSHGIGGLPKIAPEGSRWSDRMHLAIAVKKETGMPVIGVGDIVDPSLAEALISEGLVDLVAVGRGILADPGWARKALAGKAEEIVRCRHCPRCHWFTDSSRCPARLAAARP
ncbi:MAG: NADH:flavin oxidoreductase [Spirochaetia bacterium]|jgi:2,4-dienoyl-CoA reductase-like NADH-dependent reductase (Old Yellow Enzyme family)